MKQRGPAAQRLLCDTCTRTAVDGSPAAPVSARDVMQWPLAHLLPWCTIRRAAGVGTAPEDTASVFVGDVCAWVVPWPLARWLRNQAIIGLSSSLGAVSETVCSAAVFTWCEESVDAPGVSELGRSVDDIDVCLPRPWVWSYAPGDALSASVVASNGRQVPLLGDRPHPGPGATPIASTRPRSADPAVPVSYNPLTLPPNLRVDVLVATRLSTSNTTHIPIDSQPATLASQHHTLF